MKKKLMERFMRRAKAWASKKDTKPLKGGGTDVKETR